ncbi:unnamed protein product [Cyclocybe aegerita]|uniref:Uncharacterized protein n=1 Tax=Cyclocybe aegerita TaxID=1973307 RepID=A0A8S0W3E4_CYCAE|nr:unnamed protein product [Cyclocybe aegerita]
MTSSSFLSTIRRKHSLSKIIRGIWPLDADINSLVRKSSGQFVFATTVVNYVTSRRHNLVERLKVVQGLAKDKRNPPFPELGALYRGLGRQGPAPHSSSLDILLGLPEGVVELLLSDLSSVIAISSFSEISEITFLHASFPDFLLDKHRSKEFYVNSDNINAALAQEFIEFIFKYPEVHLDDCWDVCLRGPVRFSRNISKDAVATDVYAAIGVLDLGAVLNVAAAQSKHSHRHAGCPCRLHVVFAATGWLSLFYMTYISLAVRLDRVQVCGLVGDIRW